MRKCFLAMLAAVFCMSALYAQTNEASSSISGPFPLALVLEKAQYAADAGAWRPDWPVDLPPDAFKVLNGEISRASIEGEGHSLNLAFDSEGLVQEFPLFLNGAMAQVSLVYNDALEIRELTLAFSPDGEPWKIEFLQHLDSSPVLARGFYSNTWYFIFISWGSSEIRETWYDVDGNFLGAYGFSFAYIGHERRIRTVKDFFNPDDETEFHFDSRGFLTELAFSGGLYRVLYFREDLPRYWERRPSGGDSLEMGDFALQWDANGLLFRITMGEDVNYRYEYTFDEWGNWIERREIRMIRSMDHLVPTQGTVFRRTLVYRNP